MNIHDLRSAQVHFENQIDDVLISRKELYTLRDNFANYYSPVRIKVLDHFPPGQ